MAERELTRPVSLTLANGALNPSAIGWARRPVVDTSGIGPSRSWGRNKRWEYWNITTPTHVLAATISSLDYAAVTEVWVLDRRSEQTWGSAQTLLPSRGVELPGSLNRGVASAQAKDLSIEVRHADGITRLRAHTGEVRFDVSVIRPEHHDCLAVVVPWTSGRFQYTLKDVALPANGSVTIAGQRHPVPPGESWAVLDHGRGRWPYDVRWNWGAGSGIVDGRSFGIQVGGQWTKHTGSTENGILIDGELHKISEELEWVYDLDQWRRPWRIRGGGLDATFTPSYDRKAVTNLGVLASRTDQCFGSWAGRYRDVAFDGIYGWAEDVHNRW